ncbi:MAG: flagellar hook-associated protein FlgL [Phycisphaerae bacterium]|nr:flagellar hook-associated protein FlgL [Phycisphaerae bacterium]
MTSAVRAVNTARVSMLMTTDMLLNNINNNTVALLKVQDQLSSGLKLGRPSDSPAEATTIMHLDSLLEQQGQYLNNIDYADSFLASTDDALDQAGLLVDQAYNLALNSVNDFSADGAIDPNADLVKGLISQLITVANRTSRGAYIFAGQDVTEAPFESYKGGVRYAGNVDEMQTRFSPDNLIDFSFNGDDVFGALSSQMMGIADINPDITADTLLADLNGSLDRGIRRGSIVISDGTVAETVDLSTAVTVGDVMRMINDQSTMVTAAIGADNSSFTLTASGADIMVLEGGAGNMARDLGIYTTTTATTITGQDVDARLSLHTSVTTLASGAGIDLSSGLQISNSLLPAIAPIDLSAARTVGDIINAINNAGVEVRAEINADRNGLNIFNQLSGSEMTIGENGGTTASDLGVRSMTGTTKLADLNGGGGVLTRSSDNIPGVIQVTARDGSGFTVDLSTAQTVQDVMDLINADAIAAGVLLTASMATEGNGIVLTDGTGSSAQNLEVTTVSENGAFIAEQLGLNKSVASNTLSGDDVNPISANGVFSHLIALQKAMQSKDKQAITAAAERIDRDHQQLINIRGQAGSVAQSVVQRKEHMEDNVLATQKLRSDIRDIDFTEAITRYENIYTALQANLTVGSKLNTMSLLDFLG